MNVVPLLVLFSMCLAAGGVLLFVWSTKNHDADHADRLALLPLEDDRPADLAPSSEPSSELDQVIE